MPKNYRIRESEVDGLPPDELCKKLTGLAWKDCDLTASGLRRFWPCLSPGQQSFLAVQWLESEVCNGGIHQFFFNSAGILTDEALAAFKRFGADEYAALLQNAVALFPGGNVPRQQKERRKLLKSIHEEATSRLFDQPFFELRLADATRLDRFLLPYFKGHRDEFLIGDAEADALEAAEAALIRAEFERLNRVDCRISLSRFEADEPFSAVVNRPFEEGYAAALKVGRATRKEFVRSRTLGQQVIFWTSLLDRDLGAGVESLFLYSGDIMDEMIRSARAIGATAVADQIEAAWSEIPEKPTSIEVSERRKQLCTLDKMARFRVFKACDRSIDELIESGSVSLKKLATAYIAKTPGDFFND